MWNHMYIKGPTGRHNTTQYGDNRLNYSDIVKTGPVDFNLPEVKQMTKCYLSFKQALKIIIMKLFILLDQFECFLISTKKKILYFGRMKTFCFVVLSPKSLIDEV